jgi:putative DNA primase/helicase
VVVAFNAGNLSAVAREIRARHPAAEIILAADNDQWTEANPGLTKAREAALEIRAKLLVPDFTGMDTSHKPSDWNDMRRLRGAAL